MSTPLKPVLSALPTLTPHQIINLTTGELLSWEEYKHQALTPLLEHVHQTTLNLYEQHKEHVHEVARTLKHSPAEHARKHGLRTNLSLLPRDVKAKSRIEKLVQYKLLSETAAYEKNPNLHKQPHSFNKTINLGAVDQQMASLSITEAELVLSWKCWEREYVLTFSLPTYVRDRQVMKYSLPVVSEKGFIFTMFETPGTPRGSRVGGVDLGRIEPFTLAVLAEGNQSFTLTASRTVHRVNQKRERILREIALTRGKQERLASLGSLERVEQLSIEVSRKRGKAHVLGHSVKNQLAANLVGLAVKHEVSTLHVEDLRWVTGSKYGSRWNHGAVVEKIHHSAARAGITVKRVNPKNTSQVCHKCGTQVIHSSKHRSVWCGECQSSLDRDRNAALNIAKNKKTTSAQSLSRVMIEAGRELLAQPARDTPLSASVEPVTRLTG